MPTGKLLVIMDDLKDFSDKALSLLGDEADNQNVRLITVIDSALTEYQKPLNSLLTGWVHQYTKVRSPDVELVIKALFEGPKDSYFRMKLFRNLLEKGEWNKDSSYNYYLIVELIRAIPGYEVPSDQVMDVIVQRFRVLLTQRMDGFIKQYESNQVLKENQIKERQLQLQKEQQSLEHLFVVNNLNTAKTQAAEHKTTIQFSICLNNNLLQFTWVDKMGGVHALDPTDEMINLLASQKNQDVALLSEVYQRRLKKQCAKAWEEFLKKTQLIINPKDSNLNLIQNGVSSSFVLRGEPKAYTLYWINALSQENEVKLERYPEFLECLNKLNPITEEHIPEIKTYLLHVKTAKVLDRGDFSTELSNCLLRIKAPAQPKEEIKANKLDLRAFADLERVVGPHKGQAKAVVSSSSSDSPEKPKPGTVKAGSAVASLFANQAKAANAEAPADSNCAL